MFKKKKKIIIEWKKYDKAHIIMNNTFLACKNNLYAFRK